jgi:hypothetical protein
MRKAFQIEIASEGRQGHKVSRFGGRNTDTEPRPIRTVGRNKTFKSFLKCYTKI